MRAVSRKKSEMTGKDICRYVGGRLRACYTSYRLKGAANFPKTRLCLVLGDCYVDNVFVVHNNPIDTKISNRYYQYLFELSVIF